MRSRRSGASLPKRLEDVRKECRVDADPCVAHRQLRSSSGFAQTHRNAAGGRELRGIRHEISDNLLQPNRIAEDERRDVAYEIEPEAFGFDHRPYFLDR